MSWSFLQADLPLRFRCRKLERSEARSAFSRCRTPPHVRPLRALAKIQAGNLEHRGQPHRATVGQRLRLRRDPEGSRKVHNQAATDHGGGGAVAPCGMVGFAGALARTSLAFNWANNATS